jgi:hypothetical protein
MRMPLDNHEPAAWNGLAHKPHVLLQVLYGLRAHQHGCQRLPLGQALLPILVVFTARDSRGSVEATSRTTDQKGEFRRLARRSGGTPTASRKEIVTASARLPVLTDCSIAANSLLGRWTARGKGNRRFVKNHSLDVAPPIVRFDRGQCSRRHAPRLLRAFQSLLPRGRCRPLRRRRNIRWRRRWAFSRRSIANTAK